MVILKFDDMMYPFDATWQRVYGILKDLKIKACFGAVADWCTEFIDVDYDLIEVWYHGKTHYFSETDDLAEFYGRPLLEQKENFESGLSKLRSLCHNRITTFGPATNRLDLSAISIINASDIEQVCFCGIEESKKINKKCYTIQEHLNEVWVPRKIIAGRKIGTNELIDPDFYDRVARMPISIIPFHPSVGPWTEKSFCNFELILRQFKKDIKLFKDVKAQKQNRKFHL